MGSYYHLFDQECPYCGYTIPEVIFSENNYDKNGEYQDFGTQKCHQCENTIIIEMKITLRKE